MINPTSAYYTYSPKNGLFLHLRVDRRNIDIPAPFKPYFFVKSTHEKVVEYYAKRKGIPIHIEQTELKTLDGHNVVKVEVNIPTHVSMLRDAMTIESYEADIPYVRRVMIDEDWKISVVFDKLYYDIEVKDGKIVCIAFSKGNQIELLKGDEHSILSEFKKNVENVDMTLGYNSNNYDYPVLKERFRQNKLELPKMQRWYDLLPALQAIDHRKLHSWSLEWVGKNLVGIERIHTNKPFKQLTMQEIYERCMRDVEIIVELDKKFSLSDIDIMKAHISYIFPDEITLITRSIDALLLRKSRELGYVLPNKPVDVVAKKHSGAFVAQPPKPFVIFNNVLFLDCVSLYPSIMINFKISPDKERRLYPELVSQLLRERLKYKQLYIETNDKKYDMLQYALKILINAIYGAVNSVGFRIQRVDLGDEVATRGRQIITSLMECYSNLKYDVIYGDTDSVVLANITPDEEVFQMLAEVGNRHIKNTFGVDIQVEAKKFYSKFYFVKRAEDEQAAKKKYAGYVIWTEKDGWINPTLDVVGMEIVRSDFPIAAQKLQKKLIEAFLNEKSFDELSEIVLSFKKALKETLFNNEDLAYSRSITKKNYNVNAPHVRVVKKLLENNIPVNIGDKVRFLYTKLGVMPLELCRDIPVDLRHYFELLDRIAERTVGISSQSELNRWLS
jgi:DNA polymerase elongation subunit (family B)